MKTISIAIYITVIIVYANAWSLFGNSLTNPFLQEPRLPKNTHQELKKNDAVAEDSLSTLASVINDNYRLRLKKS